MSEYLHDDLVPVEYAEEAMVQMFESLTILENQIFCLRASLHKINGWLGSHEMTYGELQSLRDAVAFVGKAEPILEDAAEVIKDSTR